MRLRQLRVECYGALMFADGFRHPIGLAVADSKEVMQARVFQP